MVRILVVSLPSASKEQEVLQKRVVQPGGDERKRRKKNLVEIAKTSTFATHFKNGQFFEMFSGTDRRKKLRKIREKNLERNDKGCYLCIPNRNKAFWLRPVGRFGGGRQTLTIEDGPPVR
jgi:hypothetical protein